VFHKLFSRGKEVKKLVRAAKILIRAIGGEVGFAIG